MTIYIENFNAQGQPQKVVQYLTIKEYSLDALNETANKLLKERWQPLGGVTYCQRIGSYYGDETTHYAQAMVRYG